jgi:hypothetical protein
VESDGSFGRGRGVRLCDRGGVAPGEGALAVAAGLREALRELEALRLEPLLGERGEELGQARAEERERFRRLGAHQREEPAVPQRDLDRESPELARFELDGERAAAGREVEPDLTQDLLRALGLLGASAPAASWSRARTWCFC